VRANVSVDVDGDGDGDDLSTPALWQRHGRSGRLASSRRSACVHEIAVAVAINARVNVHDHVM